MKKLFSLLTLALLTMSAWAANTYVKVNSLDQLVAGQKYILVNEDAKAVLGAITGGSTKYGSAITVEGLENGSVDIDGVDVIELTASKVDGAQGGWVFGFGESSFLTWTSGNSLNASNNTTGVYSTNEQWYASNTTDGVVLNNRQDNSRKLQYNASNPRFACYTSAQKPAVLYVQNDGEVPVVNVADPVFNPAGGEFTGSLAVTVSCATENASIYLFKVLEDETEEYVNQFFPNDEGVVSGEFYVTESGKYGAYAYKGSDMSNNTYATFTKVLPTCATPTFDPASGTTFPEGEMLSVVISSETEGATITYTVNDDVFEGTTPVTVPVDMTTTITAIASKEGYNNSEEATATYTMVAPYNVGGTATFVAGVDVDPNFEYRQEGDLTIAKDNVTMKFHGTQYNYYTIVDGDTTGVTYTYRIYKNQDIKFSSTAGNIRKIVFDCDSSNPITGFNAVDGLNMETATWEGNAREVTFTAGSKQVRCYTITVTLDDQIPTITVANPVFAPETNTRFAGTQQVTITCETQGAAIYYSVNDGDYQSYNAPITLTETSTVKAYAELEGEKSDTVTAKYTKLVEVSTIAEANALNNKTYFVFYGSAVVVYQNGSNLWVKDDTGYGLIYGNKVPENIPVGSTLDEEWDAQYYLFRGHINEYQYPNNVTVSDAELVEIVPTEYAEAAIDSTKINERVLVKGLTLTADNDPKYLYTADGMAIYNQFEIEYPTELEGKTFDVEGMVSYYNNAVQIMPIAITEAQAAGLVGDVNNDNVVNITDVTVLISAVMTENFANINTTNADLNGDTTINITDVTMLINKVMAQ